MYGNKGINGDMALVMKRGVGMTPFIPKHSMLSPKGMLAVVHNQETKKNSLEKTK